MCSNPFAFVFIVLCVLEAGSLAAHNNPDEKPGRPVDDAPVNFMWPLPDGKGQSIAKEPKLAAPAAYPPKAEACFDRDLMALHTHMHNVGPEDTEAIRKFGAENGLGLDKMEKSEGKTASRAYLMTNTQKDKIVVAFRGSYDPEHKSLDWITNLAATPTVAPLKMKDGKETSAFIHSGYWDAANEYRHLVNDVKALVNEAKKNNRNPKVYITGHSLGGVMSVLFSYFLAADTGIDPEVVIFGSPRLDAMSSFKKPFYSHKSPLRSRHYQMKDDIVTELPPGYDTLPVPDRTLYPKSGPVPKGLAGLKAKIRNHHPQMYLDALTEECEADILTVKAKVYDAYEKELGRKPTEKEFDQAVALARKHSLPEAINILKRGESSLRKEIRRSYQMYMGRDPSEAEYSKSLTLLSETRDFHTIMHSIFASEEYRNRWIDGVYREFLQTKPTAEQRKFWLKKTAEQGDLQKSLELFRKTEVKK